jgi:hypothetical protein
MQQYYCEQLIQQQCIEESIQEFEDITREISSLTLKRENLVKKLIGHLGHSHEGQKTYEYEIWKIEVRTPCIFSLDKKKYEESKRLLPSEYNPIKESKSYTIDKNKCEKMMLDAPKNVRDVLSSFIEKKPGKASINIKGRF